MVEGLGAMEIRQLVAWILTRAFEIDVVPFDGRDCSDWYVRLDRRWTRRFDASRWVEPR
jgi:hypothetical protein